MVERVYLFVQNKGMVLFRDRIIRTQQQTNKNSYERVHTKRVKLKCFFFLMKIILLLTKCNEQCKMRSPFHLTLSGDPSFHHSEHGEFLSL